MEFRKTVTITLYAIQKKRHMYRTDFWTLWEKVRVGWFERIALKHVYYQGWNRSPVQVGCMRQVLRAGALGRPRGMGWGGRWEGGSGWGTHVNPWLIHVNVWQKPLQYCKVISLQLIKINEKEYWELSILIIVSLLYFFKLEWLLYNVVLESVVQQSESAICIHMSPPTPPHPPLWVITEHQPELLVLTAASHSWWFYTREGTYVSATLSIHPPSPSPATMPTSPLTMSVSLFLPHK